MRGPSGQQQEEGGGHRYGTFHGHGPADDEHDSYHRGGHAEPLLRDEDEEDAFLHHGEPPMLPPAVRGLVPQDWRRLLRPGVLSSLVVAGLLAATALSTLSPSTSSSDPRSRLSGQAGSKKGGLLPRLFSSEKGTHPNFVVILTDDQGMYDVGYLNGGVDIYSPVIDSLADSGVKIQRFYTQPLCTPARGAFLTGMYPINTGTEYETVSALSDWGLDSDTPTLADYLKELDYSTHLIGKWHLGHAERKYLPTSRGFDTYYGYLEAECHYYTHQTTDYCNCGASAFYDFIKADADDVYFVSDNSTRSDRLYATEAVSLIKAHNQEQPFYLQVNFQNAHRPLPTYRSWDFSEKEQAWLENIDSSVRQRFAASVMKLDEAVSRIMDALKEMGMWENTYVVFLSDNGGCFQAGGLNTPYRGTKKHLFEGGIRTPSFLSGGLIPDEMAGTSYGNMFHVTDWAPTILELAGRPIDMPLDGISQATALLRGIDQPPRDQLLINFQNKTVPPTGGVIKGRWKFLLMEANQTWYDVDSTDSYTDPSMEGACAGTEADLAYNWLFDLEADPTETTNLADTYPEIAEEMQMLIYAYLKEGVKSYYGTNDDDGEMNFNAVGYICPWLDDDDSYFLPPRYISPISDYSNGIVIDSTVDYPKAPALVQGTQTDAKAKAASWWSSLPFMAASKRQQKAVPVLQQKQSKTKAESLARVNERRRRMAAKRTRGGTTMATTTTTTTSSSSSRPSKVAVGGGGRKKRTSTTTTTKYPTA